MNLIMLEKKSVVKVVYHTIQWGNESSVGWCRSRAEGDVYTRVMPSKAVISAQARTLTKVRICFSGHSQMHKQLAADKQNFEVTQYLPSQTYPLRERILCVGKFGKPRGLKSSEDVWEAREMKIWCDSALEYRNSSGFQVALSWETRNSSI